MQSGETPDIKDYYSSIEPPTINDQELHLQNLVEQGVISPEDIPTFLQDPSAMNSVQTDPSLKNAQMDALLGLQDVVDSGGLTASDRAKLSRIASDEDAKARGQREAIIQNAEARGVGGSGLKYMDMLQNAQSAATRQSQRDLDVAGMAQDRALQALMQQGNLAGAIQNQDFSQQAQKAQANDAISRFNTQNRQDIATKNVGAQNAAQIANLQNKQTISNANTDMANRQQQYNKELLDKNFQQKMQKASGQAGIATRNAENEGVDSREGAKASNDSFKMAGQFFGGMAMSDERNKTEVEQFSPSDFLDSLTSYKYKYKNPEKYGEGEHVGVMAQDLEKSDAGAQMVTDTPEGKMVDFSKAGPSVLASLADINDRLRALEGEG